MPAEPESAAERTIAVVGASANRAKFGNKCVRAYAAEGWTVVPVHPSESEIEGLPAAATLAEAARTAKTVDRISFYLPPSLTHALLADAAAIAIALPGKTTVWLNPGSYNGAALAEAERLGLAAVAECSIVDIGRSPSEFA